MFLAWKLFALFIYFVTQVFRELLLLFLPSKKEYWRHAANLPQTATGKDLFLCLHCNIYIPPPSKECSACMLTFFLSFLYLI